VVGLFVAATAVMFVFKACPPQGPWPMPPWCEGGVQTSKTIKKFIPSKVDIYGRMYFDDSQHWIMNGNIFAFGPIVGSHPKWINKLRRHGAKAFSNISTWNSLMAKTPEELPPELKDSVLIGFDGKPLYQQGILFMNIIDPAYQNWIKNATEKAINGDIDGITIDEHQGTVQALWTGEGPCDKYSLNGFKDYLKNKYTGGELKSKGVDNIDTFNYCQYIVKNNYKARYKNDRNKVPFVNDYLHFLYSASDSALQNLLEHARQYASKKGRTLIFGANWQPLDRLDEAKLYDHIDLFIFEHDWFPPWRNDTGNYKFPAGSPVSPDMKYATGKGKTAVTMYIIQDAKELAAQGQQAGTLLIKHQFAESYANRGYYMYSDLEDFLGLTFIADRTAMLPYFSFIRQYPEAFTNLNQKNNLAVVFPPRMNTANPNQKEWAFAISASLSEANLQHDFIDMEKINDYEIIVVNGNAWSDEEVNKLLTFVKSGGTVIAYDSSFASLDENYRNKSSPQLSELKTNGTHTLGKGKFIFFNEDMGWQLWAYQKPAKKARLVDAVKQFTKTDIAPKMVQVIPYTSGNNLVVHILNYDFQNQKFLEKKDFQVQIQIPNGFSTNGRTMKIVSPEFDGERVVEFQRSGNVIFFTVPTLRIWDVGILK
ncbi:MAG: hypothetical protein QMD11_11335, partial [Smithella sp.]|nr:hypothetical protein [Smithella sp.]